MRARLGLLSGIIECTLVLLELMAGLVLTNSFFNFMYKHSQGLQTGDKIPAWNSFCMHLATNILVIVWMIFRLSQKRQPTTNISNMAAKLNLWPLPSRLSSSTMRTLLSAFLLHLVGCTGMVLAQQATGRWLFSWSNYWNEQQGWIWNGIADMLVLAPIREELTFRGLIFSIFYLRGTAFKVSPAQTQTEDDSNDEVASSKSNRNAGKKKSRSNDTVAEPSSSLANTQESLAWSSGWKVECVLVSAGTFGLVHLLNLFGARYTKTYIILQVLLGMTIGCFYALRFVQSEDGLIETVLLHMINNAFSSALPVDQELDLKDPLVLIPLLMTFIVYGSLAYREYIKLRSQPPTPFEILTPRPEPTTPAVDGDNEDKTNDDETQEAVSTRSQQSESKEE